MMERIGPHGKRTPFNIVAFVFVLLVGLAVNYGLEYMVEREAAKCTDAATDYFPPPPPVLDAGTDLLAQGGVSEIKAGPGGRADNLKAKASLQARKAASVFVSTHPSDALVSVDDKRSGVSPCRLGGLAPGRHEIEISKAGYRVRAVSLRVSGDEEIMVYLEKERDGYSPRVARTVNTGGKVALTRREDRPVRSAYLASNTPPPALMRDPLGAEKD